jgi:hypothetical protein
MKLPQELIDSILLYLDFSTLENCREIQNDFIKNTTQYGTIGSAVDRGRLNNLKWVRDQGHSLDLNTCSIARIRGDLEVIDWLKDNGCPWHEDNPYCTVFISLL